MSRRSLPTFEKGQLLWVVGILSFGLTAIGGAIGLSTLPGVIFLLGFFVLIPLILVLGEEFPLVEPAEEVQPVEQVQPTRERDPIEELRRRYARGEISETEFENRLERLLETEEQTPDPARQERSYEFE